MAPQRQLQPYTLSVWLYHPVTTSALWLKIPTSPLTAVLLAPLHVRLIRDGVEHTARVFKGTEQPKLQCDACGKESCLLCGCTPYHEGRSCDQHRADTVQVSPAMAEVQRQEGATLAMMRTDPLSKQCGGCKGWITRVEGCDKMQCLCSNRFCWKCDAPDAACECTGTEHGFWDNKRDRVAGGNERAASPHTRKRKSPWGSK